MLKTKLFILTITITSISLFLSGLVYYKNLNSIFHSQTLKSIEQDKKSFNVFIKKNKKTLLEFEKEISTNEDVIASLNLISKYESPKNYSKNVFDSEKIDLLKLSKQWIKKEVEW